MNAALFSGILNSLGQASLLIGAAWLFLLTQRKVSAECRSIACRIPMAAATAIVIVLTGQSLPTLAPLDARENTPIALPGGNGSLNENLLLTPTEEPDPATPIANSLIIITKPTSGPFYMPFGLAQSLIITWLTGAFFTFLTWLSSLAARRQMVQDSTLADGNLSWLAAAARQIDDWALVDELRLGAKPITPCVWGIFRTVLILPAYAAAWPTAMLKLVLIHECAHLRRRDPLWQMLRHLFVAMFWFHPLAWSLARYSQTADEQAADDRVLGTAADGPTYAELLVECARHFTLPPVLHQSTSAMAGITILTRRVEAVLDPGADRRPVHAAILLWYGAFFTLLVAASALAAPAISTQHDNEPTEPSSPTEEKPAPPPETPTSPEEPKPDIGPAPVKGPENPTSGRKKLAVHGIEEGKEINYILEADSITVKISGQAESPISSRTRLNLTEFESGEASGTVVLSGNSKNGGVYATARSIKLTQGPPRELIMTGWPKLTQGTQRIVGTKEDSSIVYSSGTGFVRPDACTVTEINPVSPPVPIPALESKEMPPDDRAFEWKKVPLKGRDYIPISLMARFYGFPHHSTDEGGNFELRSSTMAILGKNGSDAITINGIKFFLHWPVETASEEALISREDLSGVLDPVIRPNFIQPNDRVTTVVIDPGHGGSDFGAQSSLGKESTYTLDTAFRLQKRLEKFGIMVVLTRTEDDMTPLTERVNLAKTKPNSLLISLHFNGGSSNKRGMQTFYRDSEAGPIQSSSVALATAIHSYCLFKLRTVDLGIRSSKLTILTGQKQRPAILIECGFLSNPGEAAKIDSPDYRQSIAEAIASGVESYLKATSLKATNSFVPLRQ